MRWSFIQRVRRTVSAPKYKTNVSSCSRRSAFLFLVSSSDLGQSDSEVPGGRVKLWCVSVMMKQRDWTYRAFGPGYSRDKDGGREMEGREGHFQLGKGGACRETDLAVVVLASTCSPGSQPALQSARAIPRSRVARGAFNVEFTAIWCFFSCFSCLAYGKS